jgi:hypothetical protein
MFRKLLVATIVALGLLSSADIAKAGAPFPHCYPCSN